MIRREMERQNVKYRMYILAWLQIVEEKTKVMMYNLWALGLTYLPHSENEPR